jgi:hypothetical protein
MKDDVAIALALALALPFLAPFIAELRPKRDKRTLSIDSTGLHAQIGARKGDVPWSRIADLFTTEEHIFILGRNLNGFCIPRLAFTNPLDREEFIRLCRDYSSQGMTPDLVSSCLWRTASSKDGNLPLGIRGLTQIVAGGVLVIRAGSS